MGKKKDIMRAHRAAMKAAMEAAANPQQVASLQAELERLEAENEKHEGRIEELEAQLEEAQAAAEEAEEDEEEEEELKAKLAKARKQVQNLRNKVKMAQNKNKRLEGELDAIEDTYEGQIAELKQQLEEGAGEGVEQLEADVEAANAKAHALEEEVSELKGKLAELEDAKEQLEELVEFKRKAELAEKLTEQLTTLQEHLAARDAEDLREAFKGLGTDESAMLKIITKRSKEQLGRIEDAYKKLFDRDLQDDIDSEVGGDFKNFCLALFTPSDKYDAGVLHEAMSGIGTHEKLLSQWAAFLSTSKADLAAAKRFYELKYDQPLMEAVDSELGGDLKDAIVNLLKGSRPDDGEDECEGDEDKAGELAAELYKAGEGKRFGTDEGTLIHILSHHSPAFVEQISAQYEALHDKPLRKAIRKELDGDLEYAVWLMLFTRNGVIAKIIKDSLAGIGTDESSLARIVGRADRDTIKQVAEVYNEKYGSELVADLSSELGGNFKEAIVSYVASVLE